MGHNHTSHDYIGHNYIGHDYVGHNYIGHNYISHNSIGHVARLALYRLDLGIADGISVCASIDAFGSKMTFGAELSDRSAVFRHTRLHVMSL